MMYKREAKTSFPSKLLNCLIRWPPYLLVIVKLLFALLHFFLFVFLYFSWNTGKRAREDNSKIK